MAYLAGDNNLNEEMVLTLQEIVAVEERADSPLWPRVKILAQLDPSGLGLPTQRYLFNTGTEDITPENIRYLNSYEVGPPDTYDETNTGNPGALSGFVQWAVQQNPADVAEVRHALILSGHGSGSTEDFLLKDDNAVDSLSIPELKEALTAANEAIPDENSTIDLLGMDCCFMGMVEVFYQIRTLVKHVVAAESMVPDFGWPYHRILAAAEVLRDYKNHPGGTAVEPEKLAEIMVKEYIEHYSDYDRTAGRSVDLAWIDMSGMVTLKVELDALADALSKALEHPLCVDQILLAHWRAQTYKFDQFVDIKDLCDSLIYHFGHLATVPELNQDGNGPVPTVVAKCDAVKTALKNCVRLSGCSGFAYQHSYGLSIYFPWAVQETSAAYKALDFSSGPESKWAKFLDKYLKKTRRDIRTSTIGTITNAACTDGNLLEQTNDALAALGKSMIPEDPEEIQEVITSHLRQFAQVQSMAGPVSAAGGSKYHRSRYHRSRYHRSRWPGDREKSMKNFTAAVGTAYWPEPDAEGGAGETG